jgi:endonuclease/exonuclease/phosphatase family metal-dependent hydrolase
MLFKNHELDRAFEFIAQNGFDMFCLQEVPEAFLERLKQSSYHLAYAVESNFTVRKKLETISLVIISKYPFIYSEAIPLTYYEPALPRRSRLAARIIYGLHDLQVWPKGLGNRHALYADIEIPEYGIMRIFNIHLPLMNPSIRAEEFERIMRQKDSQLPTIVCGDFNLLEKPYITPLNWLLGGRVSDALLYKRERTVIEKHFVEHELQNALRDNVTHPLSRSQLDHILVSNSFSIKNAEVLPDRIGSDHHPICVQLNIDK